MAQARPRVETKVQFLVNKKGKRMAVLMPIAEYEELMEDRYDLQLLAARRKEPTIPWETVKQQMDDKWRRTKSK